MTDTPRKPTMTREPVPVIIVEDRDDDDHPPLRLYAILIFLGTLLGTLLGAIADLGEATQTLQNLGEIFNPPLELCVVGSDTVLAQELQLSGQWKAAFEARNRVRLVIRDPGSGAGVTQAIAGECAHVLVMSEAMDGTQYNRLLDAGFSVDCAAEIGYDVISFVTDINNPVGSIRESSMRDILRGQITDWRTITRQVNAFTQPIFILARPVEASGTTKHVMSMIANQAAFPSPVRYLECNSNEECLNMTLATPGSIYWVSTSWLRTKPARYLRVLSLFQNDEDVAINPLTDNFTLDEYPDTLARPLYMYVLDREGLSPDTRAMGETFLRFVRSLDGQQILEQNAFITYFDSAADIPISLPPGFEAQDGLRPLCRP
ncbi:MAG: substrate-binding domain-containing protein [Anaerolineae bacterium]|jgi:ABC-type phosphate transport system substrate-binding protein|nr:substrate-binding domain-containing protein [Anaerolineae bacterium]